MRLLLYQFIILQPMYNIVHKKLLNYNNKKNGVTSIINKQNDDKEKLKMKFNVTCYYYPQLKQLAATAASAMSQVHKNNK